MQDWQNAMTSQRQLVGEHHKHVSKSKLNATSAFHPCPIHCSGLLPNSIINKYVSQPSQFKGVLLPP